MAWENPVVAMGYEGSVNVSTLTYSGNPPVYASGGIPQFYVVVPDTADGNNNAVTLAANNTTPPVGIAQDHPAIGPGVAARIAVSGYSKAIAGAAILMGAALMANASGQVVTATAAGATSFFIVGYAETAATAAGDVITVRLTPGATQYVAS